MKKQFIAAVCGASLGSNMKIVGYFDTVREAKQAALAAYDAQTEDASGMIASAYAWQTKNGNWAYAWK